MTTNNDYLIGREMASLEQRLAAVERQLSYMLHTEQKNDDDETVSEGK